MRSNGNFRSAVTAARAALAVTRPELHFPGHPAPFPGLSEVVAVTAVVLTVSAAGRVSHADKPRSPPACQSKEQPCVLKPWTVFRRLREVLEVGGWLGGSEKRLVAFS